MVCRFASLTSRTAAQNLELKAFRSTLGESGYSCHVAKVPLSLSKTLSQWRKTEEDIAAWMAAETWFTAEEALEAGFADKVTSAKPKKSSSALATEFDLSVFHNTPGELILGQRDAESTERKTERLLRDAGLSRTEAKTVIVKAAEAIAQRDAGDEGREETLALLTGLSSVIRPAAGSVA